jgi:hypothetical protein
MVTVSVENTGTQTAEYVLLAECTQGIVMANPGGVPFSVAPGSSGVTIYQQIPLGLNSTTKLTPSAEDTAAGLIVPSCNVSLYPSTLVTERFLLNKTAPIKCTVDLPDGIGSIIPSVYGSGCSSWNLLCDFTFGRATFFSALEMMLIDMTLVFVFFAVIIWVLTNLIKNAGGEGAFMEGEKEEIEMLANQNKMTSRMAEKREAKENKKAGLVDTTKTK